MSKFPHPAKLVLNCVLLAVALFGLIRILLSLSGKLFYLELAGFLFLVILIVTSFVLYPQRGSMIILFFLFLAYIINLLALFYPTGELYIVLLIVAVVGFLANFPSKLGKNQRAPKSFVSNASATMEATKPEHSFVFDSPPEKPKLVSPITSSKVVKTAGVSKASPTGKFVASRTGNVYHAPACDWAKKISKDKRQWFVKKEDAWEKGYRAHSCVE